jgi:hypothetical protein
MTEHEDESEDTSPQPREIVEDMEESLDEMREGERRLEDATQALEEKA